MTMRKHISDLVMPAAFFLIATLALPLLGCSSPDINSEFNEKYEIPADMLLPDTSMDAATFSDHDAAIDATHAECGYVVVTCYDEQDGKHRYKVTISDEKTDHEQHYDVSSDGKPNVLSLPFGSTSYHLSVWQETTFQKYVMLVDAKFDVVLEDETSPYRFPNIVCDYGEEDTPDEAVISLARSLVTNSHTESEAAQTIYKWVQEHIAYDKEKAQELSGKSGYIPDPAATLESKAGICFDYASLFAAMCRIDGIPCQIVTGYVEPGNVYHAWNEAYVDGKWERYEPTFTAFSTEKKIDVSQIEYMERYRY